MKLRLLFLASVMLGVSLNAADHVALCPLDEAYNVSSHVSSLAGQCPVPLAGIPGGATVVCDAFGQCAFDTATNPELVESAVTGALDDLAGADKSLFAQAFGVLQGALEFAQATGNDYLGEYIQTGLTMVQEHYEENPITTAVVVGTAAVATVAATYYVIRGCTRLIRACFSACYSRTCKSNRAPRGRASSLVAHTDDPSVPAATVKRRGARKKRAAGVLNDGSDS